MGKATEKRNAALKRVSKNNAAFMANGLKAISKLRKRKTGYTGEDIRFTLEGQKIIPNHPNAWGALIRKAQIDDLIVPTGKFRHMVAETSNARQTQVYAINR